jgi:hypothetical protein
MPKSTMHLPKSVITQDHRLEKTAEDAGRKLCELRWHWTLDESNSKRVSLSQYARDVGRNRATIHRYAQASIVLSTKPSMLVSEAVIRASMSEERQQVTETVARKHGVTFGTAAQRKEYREEAKQIQEAKEAVKQLQDMKPIHGRLPVDTPEFTELSLAIIGMKDEISNLRKHLRNTIDQDDISDLHDLVKSLRKLATDIESNITKRGNNNGTATVTNITSARHHQRVS